MFEHSVKVPRSYKLAGNIIRQVKEEGANLKSLLYHEKNKHFPVNAVHALIIETLKHEIQLSELLKKTGLLINEPRFDPWLARVLITELLWGKQSLTSESKPVKTIRGYHKEFLSLSESLKINVEQVVAKKVLKPRYIRINTLRLTAADATRYFQDEGWNLVRCTAGPYDDFLKQVENLGPYDFMPDYHVKVVFVFAPNTQFYDCELYQNGDIILQDKATCLAGYLLAPTPGSTILDMCAAPGMKTTHLAALIKNEGTIYSVEQDEERYKMLCEFVEKSGVTCVTPLNRDVATVNKDDCPNVDYVLLDPSCSGSGIRRIEENDTTYDLESGRVQKLSGFQAKLLRHALNEYRTAKRIVYSTCSLYPQENEEVVQDVVRNYRGKFRLVSAKEKFNNNWNNVGDLKYEGIGEKCIYTRPEADYTSGFFVAVFERFDDEDTLNVNTLYKTDAPILLSSDHAVKNPHINKGVQKICDENTHTNKTNNILEKNNLNVEKSKKKKPPLLDTEYGEEVIYNYNDSSNINMLDSKINNRKSEVPKNIKDERKPCSNNSDSEVHSETITKKNTKFETNVSKSLSNSAKRELKQKHRELEILSAVEVIKENQNLEEFPTSKKNKKSKSKKLNQSESDEGLKKNLTSDETNDKIENMKRKNKRKHSKTDECPKEFQASENTNEKITQMKHKNKIRRSEKDENPKEFQASEDMNEKIKQTKHKNKIKHETDESPKEFQASEDTNEKVKQMKHKNKTKHSETDESLKKFQVSEDTNENIKQMKHKNKTKHSETVESPKEKKMKHKNKRGGSLKEFHMSEKANDNIIKIMHKKRKHSFNDESPKEFQTYEETNDTIKKKKYKNKREHCETDESPKELQSSEEISDSIKKIKHKNKRKHTEMDDNPKEFQASEETSESIKKKKHKNKRKHSETNESPTEF